MTRLDIDRIVSILNSGDAEAREAYLLEVKPDAFARGRIYNTGLSLYQILEDALAGASVEAQLAVHDRLTDPIWRRNVLLLAMKTSLAQDKVREAEALIPRLDKAYVYQGYRVLLRYYARQGDRDNYRRVLKRSDRRRARHELKRIELTFVAAYSQKMGLEAALDLIEEDEPWLIQEALKAQVGRLPYAEIHRWAERTLAGEDQAYVEVHLAALAPLLEQEAQVTDLVASLLAYISDIEPGKRIPGTNFTVRQQGFWRLGSLLLKAGLTEQVRRVLKHMTYTSSRRDLVERLKSKEMGESGPEENSP